MDDKPYIAAIDAHAESIRGDDHTRRGFHEFLLDGFAIRQGQARMVGCRFDTCPAQVRVNLLNVLSGSGIDNADSGPAR